MIYLGGTTIPTTLLTISAVFSLGLGIVVLWHNYTRPTHRCFALLSTNIALWALGVLWIIHCHTTASATFAIKATFIVACFLPATFYQFIVFFPYQRLAGLRTVLAGLYAAGFLLAAMVNSPWYLLNITVYPDAPPAVAYGPVFLAYSILVVVCMLFSFGNLVRKLMGTAGIERRQIEHVLAGIFLSTVLASTTNLLAPVLQFHNAEAYGPCFMVVMMAIFAYAMIRYHLLDILVIISRTTVYAVITAFVAATFMGTVSFVHWISSGGGRTADFFTTALAALVVALVLQPLKERIQLVLDRMVLFRRYDSKALIQRVIRNASQSVKLDELLENTARDLRSTVGVSKLRVLLVSEKDRDAVITAYSTDPAEIGQRNGNLAFLLRHIEREAEPIALQEIIHRPPSRDLAMLAAHLASMEAFLLVPLVTQSGLIGMILLGEKSSRDIYTQEDVRTFATLAGPVAAAVENARLYGRLEQLNMHMERIMSSMRAGVVAVDQDGTITTVNQQACELMPAARPGESVSVLEPKVADLLRLTLQERRGISDVEMVITGPDSELLPVAMSTSSLVTPDNQIIGAMVLIFNLTEIKRLESTVQRADRLTSIGTMAAGMAHEIKNPLVSIKTFSQLLLDRYDDEDFRKTFAEVVPPEVQRIDSIVSRLLDFARPKPVVFAPLYLRDVISDVLALVENQMRKANVEVFVEFPQEERTVTADEQLLHQLFLNLILNALDAMRDSRDKRLSIKLQFTHSHLQREQPASLLDVPCAKIYISDTGCGIAEKNISQLFTPFYTTKEHGSGLGLSVVHGIVTQHKGDITVTSALGVGTTFILTFPLTPQSEPEIAVNRKETIGAGGPKT